MLSGHRRGGLFRRAATSGQIIVEQSAHMALRPADRAHVMEAGRI